MSKIFDETQKARQWSPVPESRRPDVVSVMDAIKQSEPVVADVTETTDVAEAVGMMASGGIAVSVPLDIAEFEAEKAIRGPVKTLQGDSPLPAPAVEAYGSLRARVMKLKASKGIRSLMLTSSVPGEGKTWTSLNLAVSCAKLQNLRILLVDGDLRSRGLTRLLKIPEGQGLSDFLAGKAGTDKNVLPTEHDNLFVLGAGAQNGQPSELFASSRWTEFIGWASQSYGIVIVDAPPLHLLSDAELISAGCDAVIMILRALSTPREIVQKCVNRIDKKKLIGVVFNGLQTGHERHSYYYNGVNGNSDGNGKGTPDKG